MNEKNKPLAKYEIHHGAALLIQFIALIVIPTSLFLTQSKSSGTPMANLALYSGIFAMIIISVVLLISLFGSKTVAIFYQDRFEIKSTQLAAKQTYLNTDLVEIAQDKGILSLTIKGSNNPPKMALRIIAPDKRVKLVKEFERIIEKQNQKNTENETIEP